MAFLVHSRNPSDLLRFFFCYVTQFCYGAIAVQRTSYSPAKSCKNPLHPSSKYFIIIPIKVGWCWLRKNSPSLITRWSLVQVQVAPHSFSLKTRNLQQLLATAKLFATMRGPLEDH